MFILSQRWGYLHGEWFKFTSRFLCLRDTTPNWFSPIFNKPKNLSKANMSSNEFNFKSDLRALADKIKSDATVTGNTAIATKAIMGGVLEEAGLTEEQAIKVNNAYSLVANAAILAGGEMALPHFEGNKEETAFTMTVPGAGRDKFDAVIRNYGTVTIPANKTTGAAAYEQDRALQVGSQRWTHHSNRTAAEYSDIKKHLNHIGTGLLASLDKKGE